MPHPAPPGHNSAARPPAGRSARNRTHHAYAGCNPAAHALYATPAAGYTPKAAPAHRTAAAPASTAPPSAHTPPSPARTPSPPPRPPPGPAPHPADAPSPAPSCATPPAHHDQSPRPPAYPPPGRSRSPPHPAAPAHAAAPPARSAACPPDSLRYPCPSGRPLWMRLGHQARTTAPGGRPPHQPLPPNGRLPGYVLLLRSLSRPREVAAGGASLSCGTSEQHAHHADR